MPTNYQNYFILVIAAFFLQPIRAATQDTMYIHYHDGTVKEYAIADIQKLTFDQATDARKQAALLARFIELKAYPNPAREFVNIDYALSEAGNVIIDILNTKGQRVFFTNRGNQHDGVYQFRWNTQDMPPGLYICRIQQNNETIVEKIIINK